MHYVYVLRSLKDKNLYIGCTADLRNRLFEHQNGQVVSTKTKRPFELIFYEAIKNRSDAKRRERYFKTSKGKASLRVMLRGSLQKD